MYMIEFNLLLESLFKSLQIDVCEASPKGEPRSGFGAPKECQTRFSRKRKGIRNSFH